MILYPYNWRKGGEKVFVLTELFIILYTVNCLSREVKDYSYKIIMRPSSVGGGRILRRTLSVCPSVRPSRSRK